MVSSSSFTQTGPSLIRYRNKLCIQCVYYNGYHDPNREGMTDTLALPNLTIG
jgi:hypothetical protein